MNTLRIISSIISLSIFIVLASILFIGSGRDKKRAFESGFSGKVISTLKTNGRGSVVYITVEILNDHSRCFIMVSPIKEKNLYPQYRDSLFKEADSDIIYLKKEQNTEVSPMNGTKCLNIDCREEK